ncbi:DNA-binding protein modulo [Eurosta solidaginis]|uniref:DNA-binding protein modulo n=1 Tax=Eurosta solidaginis TaxID=178769 RepID=UPI00353127BA
MKQKKGNVSLKSPLNGAKNDCIAKTPKNVGPKTPAKGTPAKFTPKKGAKTPVKVVPPRDLVEEEEEEEDSGADVAAGVIEAEASDVEEEEGGNDDSDDEEDDDAENGGQDEEDDDDEDAENGGQDDEESDEDDDINVPDEAPIGKESEGLTPKLKKGNKANADNETGVPNIKTGALPKDFPKNQVLVVKNLPRTYKQIDLVEVFAKFGTLHTIYNNHGPNGSVAFVAYSSPEEAEAAQVATNEIAQVKGKTIAVNIQLTNKKIKGTEDRKKSAEEKKASYEEKKRKIEESKDRTVYVKNLKRTITEDKIKEHFAECGDIESIRKVVRPPSCYAFITFTDVSSVSMALKRHYSILDEKNIWVMKSDVDVKEMKDPLRTVIVKNTKSLEYVDPEILELAFSSCGEIENISILCTKNVLAFVTYKDPKCAKKALKLTGTTTEDLELEVEEYKVITPKSRLAIFIQNIKPDVTEEDIRERFASCGPIENVIVNKHGYAIVRFEDMDGFCKSFSLNETFLHGNMLFLEPYSEKKQVMLKKKHTSPLNRKRQGAPYQKSGYGKKRKLI